MSELHRRSRPLLDRATTAKPFHLSIAANLELASLPTTTPVERKKLLSFVVCGGGPTGVEFAAELADMMSEDVLSYVSQIPAL